MTEFIFLDRQGGRQVLAARPGEAVHQVLARHHIPPASVISLRDGVPISDTIQVDEGAKYESHLIEGYDISSIQKVLQQPASPFTNGETPAYVKRRLSFSKSGDFRCDSVNLSLPELSEYVENTISETCKEFDLLQAGDGVLVGLSGGVDSSSLLISLARTKEQFPAYRLAAVTFEDYDSAESPTFTHASRLASELGVEHTVAPATLAQEVFGLTRPLREILPLLMDGPWGHFVMYIDHHTTRRTLEVFAKQNGLNKIALGLHTTDLIAGMLNGWMTGYHVADIPSRRVGDVTYIYPLAFLAKRELHLYHFKQKGVFARHSSVNAWERRPLDRNFYYYTADQLQSLWPGLEAQMFLAHSVRLRGQRAAEYDQCANCGSALLHQPFTTIDDGECDACVVFRRAGFRKS